MEPLDLALALALGVGQTREILPDVGHGQRRDQGRARLERASRARRRRPGTHARRSPRRPSPSGAPPREFCAWLRTRRCSRRASRDDRLELGQADFLDPGHARRQHGRLARHDLDDLRAVADVRPDGLHELERAVGLAPELVAVTAGDRQRRSGGQHPRSGDLSGVDRGTQHDIEVRRRAGAASGRHPALQRAAGHAGRPEHELLDGLEVVQHEAVLDRRVDRVVGVAVDQAGQQGRARGVDHRRVRRDRACRIGRLDRRDQLARDDDIEVRPRGVAHPVDDARTTDDDDPPVGRRREAHRCRRVAQVYVARPPSAVSWPLRTSSATSRRSAR